MRKNLLYIVLLSGIISIYTDCNREEDACKFGVCGIAYVRAKLSIPNDTMYVGDTLIIGMTIPDSIYQVGESGDTMWEHVNTFRNMWAEYDMILIDTASPNKIGHNPSAYPEILEGGEKPFKTFSEAYPYRNKVLYVLKKSGTYFLSTSADLNCRINDRVQGMIIEWEVPEKHFEWLEEYILAQGGTVPQWESYDKTDVVNIFPFKVLER